jgi:hypothetical protein
MDFNILVELLYASFLTACFLMMSWEFLIDALVDDV